MVVRMHTAGRPHQIPKTDSVLVTKRQIIRGTLCHLFLAGSFMPRLDDLWAVTSSVQRNDIGTIDMHEKIVIGTSV